MVHDVSFILEFGLTVKSRLVPIGPDSAQHQRQVLIPVAVAWCKDEQHVDARIDVEEKTAYVMQAENPGRKSVLVPLQAVDEFVDGGGFVDVEKVCRNVADEEGHNDGQKNGGQSSLSIHVEISCKNKITSESSVVNAANFLMTKALYN